MLLHLLIMPQEAHTTAYVHFLMNFVSQLPTEFGSKCVKLLAKLKNNNQKKFARRVMEHTKEQS